MRIGFIGVGSMGAAIIPNLVRAGHEVSAWNRTPGAVEQLGVTPLPAASAAFQGEAVITMLADDAAVRSVILDGDVLQTALKNCVHVVMSTISPQIVEELRIRHQELGLRYVVAPVFGVPAVAAKAELNIIAAGPSDALDIVQPLFDAIGQRTWRLGEEQTHAMITKIAGNMMITLAIEAMGEAAGLVERYGLKSGDFLQILTNTLFSSPSYRRYGANIAAASYDPGFKLTLGLKDVNLALDAARARGQLLPAVEIAQQTMMEAIELGLGTRDWSSLAEITRKRSKQSADLP